MKVMCIDNKPGSETFDVQALRKLKEGEIYTASQGPHPDGYILSEVSTRNPSGFSKHRFVPTSTIDETELLTQRETNVVQL